MTLRSWFLSWSGIIHESFVTDDSRVTYTHIHLFIYVRPGIIYKSFITSESQLTHIRPRKCFPLWLRASPS